VNNIRLLIRDTEQAIEIPINTNWDLNGVNESIDVFENEILKQIINPIDDFETIRYSHSTWNEQINGSEKSSIDYEFYFYSATTDSGVTAETTANNWVIDYRANNITTRNILYNNKVFSNSFFKLDFYDDRDISKQQIYLTVIIPTRTGLKKTTPFGFKNVDINIQKFVLYFVGDKEGYFIYWLKDTSFINLSTLYMTAKYFDASIGQFKKMMTVPQGLLTDKFNFQQKDYFYYVMNLNYNNYTYEIYEEKIGGVQNRIGTTNNPIKWYEYVNPQ